MLTLREALQRRGTVQGYIDLVVARQTTSQPTLTHCCSSDVLGDLLPPTADGDKSSKKTTHDAVATKTAKGVSRNMSYQLANVDSFVSDASGLSTPPSGAVVARPVTTMKAPTINGGHGDTVLIETEESRPSSVSSALSLLCCLMSVASCF